MCGRCALAAGSSVFTVMFVKFASLPVSFIIFASKASKKLSESVVETSQTLKKSVEERKINGIMIKVNCSSDRFRFRYEYTLFFILNKYGLNMFHTLLRPF